MRREWEPEDLIASWTMVEADWELVANKAGSTRIGFVVLLKFFEIEGQFPQYPAEVPEQAVTYLAEQVKVDPSLFVKYDFASRSARYHRAQIRGVLGFRECSEADQDELAGWLCREVCANELRRDRLRDAVIARCRAMKLEPPTPGQISRLVGSGIERFEESFCRTIEARLDAVDGAAMRLEQLTGSGEGVAVGGGERFLSELKSDPGPVGTETFMKERAKLPRQELRKSPAAYHFPPRPSQGQTGDPRARAAAPDGDRLSGVDRHRPP